MSYQRQVEAGMRNPGMAGLTADRLGDAARWKPTGDESQGMVSPKSSSGDDEDSR